MPQQRQLRLFRGTQGKVNPYNVQHYMQRSEVGTARGVGLDVKREICWDGRHQVTISKHNHTLHRNNKEYFTMPRKMDDWSQARKVPADLVADPQYLPGITFTP